jgi:hypothetical protein
MAAITGHDLTAGALPYRASETALISGGIAGTNKLWLSAWSGDVLLEYDKYRSFEMLVDHRTVTSPVVEFPITGSVTGQGIWNAGQELIGSPTDNESRTFAIRIDKRPMVAFFELDEVDLELTQWEFKSELARQCAEWLANTRDAQLAIYVLRAACEEQISGDPRSVTFPVPIADTNLSHLGNTASTDDQRTTAALLYLKYLENYCVFMQENNIPINGPIYSCVSPRAFQDIRSLSIARDATGLAGGAGRPLFGGVAEAGGLGTPLGTGLHKMTDALEYQGVIILKTNQLATGGALVTDNTLITNKYGETKYNLDLASADVGIKSLIWQPEAVCGIRMAGVKPFSMYDGRRNTTFVRVSMHAGTGVKRPELAQVLHSKDNTSDTRAEMQALISNWSDEYVNTSGSAYPFA